MISDGAISSLLQKISKALVRKPTFSEERIFRDYLKVFSLRHDESTCTRWIEENIENNSKRDAEICIGLFEKYLFPHEHELKTERAVLLSALNQNSLRANFDLSLESSALTIHFTARSAEAYREIIERLNHFDFEHWQRVCDHQRIHAD